MFPTKLFLIAELGFLLFLTASKLTYFSSLSSIHQEHLIQRWSFNFSLEILNRLIGLVFLFFIFDSLTFGPSFQSNEFDIGFFVFYILLLDFVFYWRHRFYHRWLWFIHNLHHSDTDFDFTLSLRLHPFETCVQIALFFTLSILLPVSDWQFILATQIFTFQAMFSHLEIILPSSKLKSTIKFVFV